MELFKPTHRANICGPLEWSSTWANGQALGYLAQRHGEVGGICPQKEPWAIPRCYIEHVQRKERMRGPMQIHFLPTRVSVMQNLTLRQWLNCLCRTSWEWVWNIDVPQLQVPPRDQSGRFFQSSLPELSNLQDHRCLCFGFKKKSLNPGMRGSDC